MKGAVQESYRLLNELLKQENEISIAINEGRLIINGRPTEKGSDSVLRPFLQLLIAHNLHSLTFLPGIRENEMIPFFRLAAGGELKRSGTDPMTFFTAQNVEHIKLNEARYAKISDEDAIVKKDESAPIGNIADGLDLSSFENLSLNELLKKLIDKSVSDPNDKAHLFQKALGLVKQQIDQAVEKVVVEFNREKTRITSERERTEEVIGGMAEGVVVVDESGKVLMMNPVAESIYGVKLGESLGKPLWEGVREEQMVSLAKDLSTATSKPVTKEIQIMGNQDIKKTLRASTAAIQDTSGRVVGMVSVLSDVTKQKELTRLQNEFMANVTHDLRSPIHAMKLAVTAILEGAAGPTTPEQQKMLSVATRNADRLSRLIDDLLDFSKIESGAMEVRPQVIEIEPLLREAVTSMESWSKSRGVTVAFQEEPGLPAVFADADRILQVVNNLISNAIKFTPAGGRITLRARPFEEAGKPMLMVEVEDTGKGITKEDQKRIFERFIQLENAEKLDVRGTGLGLSICRALVQLHKGKLSIQSPPPGQTQGSLFGFSLPSVQKSSLPQGKTAGAGADTSEKMSSPRKPSFWKRMFFRHRLLLLTGSLFLASVASARPYLGTVRRVLDCNTLQLTDGTKVRYLGISGPLHGTDYYAEAVGASRMMVEGKEARFRYGVQERDKEGIWTAYVYVDGFFINEELVRQGLALVTALPNDEKVLPDLIAAEREAHAQKRGQWRDTTLDVYPIRIQKKNALP